MLDTAQRGLSAALVELSALRAENESIFKDYMIEGDVTLRGVIERYANATVRLAREKRGLKEEIEKLRAREAPKAAWLRCASFFMSDAGESWLRSHQCNRLLIPYQPPQEAPAETSWCTCYAVPCEDDTSIGTYYSRDPKCPEHGANRKAERCTCRPAPWFGYADDCPKHGGKVEPAGTGEKR